VYPHSRKRRVLSDKRKHTYPDNWDEICAKVDERDGNRCKKCGVSRQEARQKGLKMHHDHIRRLADGGTNALYNLQLLCSTCHSKRVGHRHMYRFNKKRRG
jgi:5-methylcytosine-specific restriction protein A